MAEMYLEIIRWIFIVGGVVALIFGVLLWFAPDKAGKMSDSGNKWYSGRKSTKSLDIMRDTDGFYFGHHKGFGVFMILASIVALILIATRMPAVDASLAGLEENSTNAFVWGVILDGLKWVFLIVIALGLPVWILLTFAPEKLKVINTSLNRWVSTRMLLLPLEKMNTGFDAYVIRHHRVFSSIFVLGAIFILIKFLG